MEIRLERFGDSYRLIGLKCAAYSGSESAWTAEARGAGRYEPSGIDGLVAAVERCESSIYRARSKIKEYGLCNDWEYFATFTLNEKKQDRFNLAGWVKDFGIWIGNYNKRYGCKLRYLIIPEQHKSGAWHAHGLLAGLATASLVKNEHGYLDLPYYARRFGFVSLDPIKDKKRCASYVTKYVSKDAQATARAMERGAHLYYASRGLNGKEIVETWNGDFVAEWENDFVKIRWLDEKEIGKYVAKRAVREKGTLCEIDAR